MERCSFCQGDLEPGTRSCSKCGQTQLAPLTDTPTQPEATTPLSALPVGPQDKIPDTPTIVISVQGTASETPNIQESESKAQQGAPTTTTEALTQQCPICQKMLPARAYFCSACGHRFGQPAELPGAKTVQKVTLTAATTHQESTDMASAQAAPAAQQASPHEQATTSDQQRATPPEVAATKRENHIHEEIATEAKATEVKEVEEEDGPITTFRKRRIAFKTLRRPLQVLLVVTLAQISVVALLLATQDLPQPQVSSGVIAEGQFFIVPLAAFIVLAVSITAGSWLALAGALRVHWSVRFLVVALATGMLAYRPIFDLTTLTRFGGEPFATTVRLRWIQLALLALFWIWAAGVSLIGWRAKRKAIANQVDTRPWHGWTFVMVLAPILIYYGLEFVIWRAYINAGLSGAGTSFFLGAIGSQSLLLPFFLGLLIYWSSTDLLEWGEIIAKSFVVATRRVRAPWLLLVLTSLAAVGMIVNVLRLTGRGIILGLVILAVLTVIVALIVRFAQIRLDWPVQVPPLALLLGAVILFIRGELTLGVTSTVATSRGLALGVVEPLSLLVSVPLVLVALTIGLVLVARGRMGKPKQGAVGLFLVLVVLLLLFADLPDILSAAGFSIPILQQPLHLLNSLQVLVAVGVLIWLIRLLARRRPLAEATKPLTFAFLLLVGLQTIDWLQDLLDGIAALGERSTILLATLFVLTVLWDLVTSGEQLTNSDSLSFPREGRILLYLGYTLVATSTLLYTGSLRASTTGAAAPVYLTNDDNAIQGLFILGPSLVVLTFLLSMGRRVKRTTVVAPASQPVRRISPRAMQLGIVGSGALVIALVVVFLMVSALPRLAHVSALLLGQTPYTAPIPGPGCDSGEARWDVAPDAPISTRCLSTGLQVTENPKSLGLVGFSPPGNTHSQNYRVSVHVDLSSLPDGCTGIDTHFSVVSYYRNTICADGGWSIVSMGESTTVLAAGEIAQANAYTIEATTEGPNQRLAINGIGVASVSSVASTTGDIELELFNDGTGKESEVFSDFVFTPLPTRTPASPQTVYQTSTPGPGCDKGGAQWVLMTRTTTTVQCLSTGMQIEMIAQSRGLVAFLPPGATFPHNYRVSVQVDLSNVPKGCVGIGLRASAEGGYQYVICSDGLWFILRTGHTDTDLAGQRVMPANSYTIEATIDGSHQRFAINGVAVPAVSDNTFTNTAFISLGLYNASDVTESAVFSDFVFTPLP